MKIRGIFSWPGGERRSDRYGLIFISAANYADTANARVDLDIPELMRLEGRRVHIVAKVTCTRESSHIGDLFRGIFPSKPDRGEVVDLGTGVLFTEPVDDDPAITFGLRPDDGRESDWFDPHKLYRLHDQTVCLTLTEVA